MDAGPRPATKLSDELIEELNAELNAELGDDMELLAQAFRGEIVLFDEKDLADPAKLISYPGLDLRQASYTGKCRYGGECGDAAHLLLQLQSSS